MDTPETSAQCRLKAEDLEVMARIVSDRVDRERFAAEARGWRLREASALAREMGAI